MKSHVRALLKLMTNIYRDVVVVCGADFQNRDLKTIRSRVEKEGLSFLMITLPDFCRDFEKSLDIGRIDSTLFKGFSKSGRIPAFLQGIVSLVFDKTSGGILNAPSIEAIEGTRQITSLFKKLRHSCSKDRNKKAIDKYIEDEESLSEYIDSDDLADFSLVSDLIWPLVLPDHLFDQIEMEIPNHGPGATQEKVSGNQKFHLRRWHLRIERYFPFFSYGFNLNSYESKEFNDVKFVDVEHERPIRVVFVPKTLKSPRVIAIEPVCVQYVQHGISKILTRILENHWLTSGHINFSDQTVNQDLAIKSSIDRSLATIDLTSASDRVSARLVGVMTKKIKWFQSLIFCCRSRTAILPDSRRIRLKKFASMGSNLCFPIESMFFYTLCIVGLLRERNLPITLKNIIKCSKSVYVYGDDIIIPTDEAPGVCKHLEKFACKVNHTKTFWNGFFRESCGMDSYRGENVTPTYLRETIPTDTTSSARQ